MFINLFGVFKTYDFEPNQYSIILQNLFGVFKTYDFEPYTFAATEVRSVWKNHEAPSA